MNNLSFIIGSGFSEPAGIPSTSKINERLRKINATEIYKDSSGTTFLLNDNTGSDSSLGLDAHLLGKFFIQEFIEFYIAKGTEFHYEYFYDYYHNFLINNNYPEDLTNFFNNFKQKYNTEKEEYALLCEFDQSYNQFIAQLLSKSFEKCHLAKLYHPRCDRFLNLIEALSNKYIVNLHSLNHDLYIEYLSCSDSIRSEMDDGFEEFGSPYYGELYAPDEKEKYMVRISRFTDNFKKPVRLFKLHGSVDFYWFKSGDNIDLIRQKWGIRNTVYKEIIEDGLYKYENAPLWYYPDFLSGTTYKTRRYSKGPYYPIIFDRFEKNLKASEHLIIIGYGFSDNEINRYITDAFLANGNKMIFIVDIKEPKTSLLDHPNVFYVPGGVVNMDTQFILNKISYAH